LAYDCSAGDSTGEQPARLISCSSLFQIDVSHGRDFSERFIGNGSTKKLAKADAAMQANAFIGTFLLVFGARTMF
jgi:hypothetical protein